MLTQRQGPDLPLGVAPQAGQVRTETWECPPGPQPTRSPSAAPVVPAPTLPAPAPPPGLTGNPSPAPTQAPLLPVLEPAGSLTRRTGLRLPPVGSSSGASLRYTSSKAKPCTSCRPPTGPPQGPQPSSPSCSFSRASSFPSPRGAVSSLRQPECLLQAPFPTARLHPESPGPVILWHEHICCPLVVPSLRAAHPALPTPRTRATRGAGWAFLRDGSCPNPASQKLGTATPGVEARPNSQAVPAVGAEVEPQGTHGGRSRQGERLVVVVGVVPLLVWLPSWTFRGRLGPPP